MECQEPDSENKSMKIGGRSNIRNYHFDDGARMNDD